MQNLRGEVLFRYAQFLTFFGLKARALEFVELALRADPRHQRAWTFLGFLSAELGRSDAAVRAFEQAIALKPSDAGSSFNLGFVLQRAGRHAEAAERFARTVELDPHLDRAWYGAGLSLAQQ